MQSGSQSRPVNNEVSAAVLRERHDEGKEIPGKYIPKRMITSLSSSDMIAWSTAEQGVSMSLTQKVSEAN
jgi:hypothetical protein